MNILFRADSSAVMGIGHIMRCLTLADELVRQGHNCWFVCRTHHGHASALITARGHGLTMLPAGNISDDISLQSYSNDYAQWLGVTWQEDAKQTREVLNQFKVDWLVVDHYALDYQWQRAVASAVGHIMVVDDLANREHDCAILLDQNLGRMSADYAALVPSGCKFLIGPSYALLRPEFAEQRTYSLQRRQNAELKRVLISMGGVDQHNVTGMVLNTLANCGLPRKLELDVVLGATAPHIQTLQMQLKQLPFVATLSVGVTDMAQRMSNADVAIGAAGGSAWERCCLGLPSLLIVLADNQLAGAKALAATTAALLMPSIDTIVDFLPEQVEQISNANRLASMSAAAANITAGLGIYTVANTMNGMAGL